jgi:adenylosuccinate synthase
VVVRYAVRINGLSALAVTKLDVLDTLEKVGLCTGYEVEGEVMEEFPGDIAELEGIKPRYEWFDGWCAPTGGARKLADLPKQARAYLDRIEALVECPIRYVSVGTRRDQILETNDGNG